MEPSSQSYEIEVAADPEPIDIATVREGLAAYNMEHAEDGRFEPLTLFTRSILQRQHGRHPANRRQQLLRTLLTAGAMLTVVFAACGPAAEPRELSSGSTPTRGAEPLQTPPLQAVEHATPLPTAPDAGGEPPAVSMPAPSQETAKATPLPATGSQTGVTPEIRPAGDPNSPFVQVSVGLFHSCGLRADGSIVCWGASGEDDRLTEATGLIDSPPGTFSQISAGDLHSCALRRDGTVECWGGMLVEDLFQDDTPPEAKAMMETMLAPPEGRFISVSAGFHFSCGVRIDNSAECWGLAVVAGAPTPPDGKYTSVSAGGFHTCGIRIDQTVVCWGSNSGFDGDFLGQATPPDGPFEVISAGGYHTCGFRPDGEIRCWGSIVGGQDGEIQICEPQADGTSRCWTDERVNEAYRAWGGDPDSVPDGSRKVIDSGQRFSCALWYEGSIGCWGSGSPDGWPPPGPFKAFSVSRNHGCGLRQDGSIECWGEDTFGQASPP